MQNIEELINKLYTGVVEFEYKKKDGSIRKTIGTLCEKLLPEKEEIKFDIQTINVLLKIKNISLNEYIESNGLELIKKENDKYVFIFKKNEKRKQDNIITYYDLENNSFRSFIKENLIKYK